MYIYIYVCVCVCTVSYTCVAYSVARSFNYLLLRYLFWGCSERMWKIYYMTEGRFTNLKCTSSGFKATATLSAEVMFCCSQRDTWTLSFRESSASYNLKWLCWNLTPLLCPRDLQRVWNLMHLKTLSLHLASTASSWPASSHITRRMYVLLGSS